MFGGLDMKGPSKDGNTGAAAAPAPAASSFSFLQSSIGTEPSPPPDPATSSTSETSVSSMFGFLSSSIGMASGTTAEAKAETSGPVVETVSSQDSNDATPAPVSIFDGLNTSNNTSSNSSPAPASSFSFLSSAPSPAPAPSAEAAPSVPVSGSSFSFMSGMIGGATDAGGETANPAAALASNESGDASGAETVTSAELKDETPRAAGGTMLGGSGFSFMSSTPAPPEAAPAPPTSSIPNSATVEPNDSSSSAPWGTSVATPKIDVPENSTAPAPASSDLLSMTNPGLPVGSGVSWSAPPLGGVKKTIKKRNVKTRVGVGAASASAGESAAISSSPTDANGVSGTRISIPEPAPSLYEKPTIPSVQPIPKEETPSTREKAELAIQNADQFIREKQRSAIAMAAERAMIQRSTSHSSEQSDGSGWKITNISEQKTPTASPKDETYRAAKAAAEEARQLATNAPHSKEKRSIFSGFFGRSRSNAGSNSGEGISSYSSHGGVVGMTSPVSTGHASGMNPVKDNANSLSPTQEHNNANAADRIQRENDEAKRAMAERALQEIQREREEKNKREKEEMEKEEMERRKRETEAAELERLQKEQAEREEQERMRRLEEEAAAKRRSPRDKVQSIIDHFADVTRTSTDRVTQLIEKRSTLVKQRMEAEKTERFASQQMTYAENQQTKAVEEEDFEAADRLASVIERHATERDEQNRIVKSIENAIGELDREREAASSSVAACFQHVHSSLLDFEKEYAKQNKGDETEIIEQFAQTSKRLTAENERLNSDLKHIERDEALIAEEQKELGGNIAEETKEYAEKCNEASEKLDEVNKHIEQLKKQLAKAENEAAALNADMSYHKKCIENVRAKFSRQLARLDKKETSVKESRAEWEAEKSSLDKAREAHETVMAAHSEELLSRDKLISDIAREASVAKDLEEVIAVKFDEVGAAKSDVHTNSFDSEVLEFEAAVDEARRNVHAAETTIGNLQDELSTIGVRIPILEAEKKMAASKRDFKAAGKASKEIKDAMARKEWCESELSGDAMQRKQLAEKELEKANALLKEKQSVAAARGREVGRERMSVLRAKIEELKSILGKFNSEESGSEDAISVACVGAYVLESQIGILEAEGESLGEQYGGWDDISDNQCSDSGADDNGNVQDNGEVRDNSGGNHDADNANCSSLEVTVDPNVIDKYKALRQKIAILEVSIDEAAAEEDYDKAAELDEEAQSVRAEISSWGISVEKLEAAATNGTSIADKDLTEAKEVSISNDVKEQSSTDEDDEGQVAPNNLNDSAEINGVSPEADHQ